MDYACLTKQKCLIKVNYLYHSLLTLIHIRFYHTHTEVFDMLYRQAASPFENSVIYNISDVFHVLPRETQLLSFGLKYTS